MALYFFTALLFAIFSGLFYLASPERIAGPENTATSIAGLFDACAKAAVVEARNDPTLGAAPSVPAMRVCVDHPPGTGLSNSAAIGLTMPEGKVLVEQLKDADASQPLGPRVVVTYIPSNTPSVDGAAFPEVVRQIQEHYGKRVNVGIVQAGGATYRKLDNGAGVTVIMPIAIPLGAIAAVTRID